MVMDIKAQSQCQRPAKPFKICQNHGEKVRYSVRSTLPLMISRRHFIQNSLAATAALALPSTALAEFFEYPAFDLHCHPGLFVAKGDPRYLGDAKAVKTVTEMNEGKVMGAFVGLDGRCTHHRGNSNWNKNKTTLRSQRTMEGIPTPNGDSKGTPEDISCNALNEDGRVGCSSQESQGSGVHLLRRRRFHRQHGSC